jgi:pimeloyl-ACP methyl ester carboxylesterase
VTPLVLIHGGGFDSRCWERLVPHLEGPALAVDLPGRGRHPMALEDVDFAGCAASVAADVDDAGFDEVVLVGHSLAGCVMPSVVAALGDRVRHVAFVAATVPEDGVSALETLDDDLRARAAADATAQPSDQPGTMDDAMARIVLGDDLDTEQFAWCVARLVPEALQLVIDPVDLTPLRGVPCTWVRTLQDVVVPAERQLRFAANLDDCPVVDLAAGHMCMVSRPAATAAILDHLAQ